MGKIQIDCGEYQDLVINSFRYCLGQMSYAVSEQADFLLKNWHNCLPNTKSLILRELQEGITKHQKDLESGFYQKHGLEQLGIKQDYETWKSLYDALIKQ